MKLADIPLAEELVVTRRELTDRIRALEGGRITISISGSYQDEMMVQAMIPAAVAELKRRLRQVDEQLLELGVEID